jgi:pro-apoptotic serine protease NMA111
LGGGVLVTVEPIPLIVVSRTLVPISICDIWITIGNRSLPGRVVYLGIVTVVTINGTLLRSADVLPISTNEYKVGDRLDLFSIDNAMQLVQLPTELREIAPIMSGPFNPPRWRIKNVEAMYILGAPASNDGFLIDPEEKSVVALWMTIDGIRIGLDYNRYIRPIIETLQNAKENDRCSGWIFGWMSLPNAIHLGLNDQRAAQMATLVSRIRSVHRAICISGKLRSVTQDNLKIGDIILEVNNLPVVRMADIHNLSQIESAQILVLRDRQEILVNLDTQCLPSEIMSRIMLWAGAFLHETHDSVLEQITPEFEEIAQREGMADIRQSVYISSIRPGSPASIGLLQSNWILEVHGHKVRTMDDMLHVNSTLHNEREYLRVKMIASNGVMSVRSVRLDSKFWPAWILEWKDNQWVCTELE